MTTLTPMSFQLGRATFAAGALFFVVNQCSTTALGNVPAAHEGVTTLAGQAQVVDGDTIDINGQRIRLEGIDAPETAQACTTSTGVSWACGRAATKALAALVAGIDVACDSRGTDKYGRVLGVCFADGRDINGAMVKAGMAWAFVRYSTSYVTDEGAARTAKTGIWQGPSKPPGTSGTKAGRSPKPSRRRAARSRATSHRRAISTTCLGAPGMTV